MAGGGVGEAMLIGAAVGAGTGGIMSAAQDKDPLEGALLGAAMGAAGGGIGSAVGGAASGAATGATSGATTGTAGGVAGGVEGGVAGGTAGGASGVAGEATSQLGQQALQNAATTQGFTIPQGYQLGTGTLGNQVAASQGFEPLATGTGFTEDVITKAASPQSWGQQGIGQGFAPSLTNAQAYGAGAGGGIMGLVGNSQNQGEQWAPEQEPYSGSLSYFKYNPQTFRPSVAPGYADGGVASLQPTAMYPQSQLDTTQFAIPSQRPASREVVNADYDARINPYTGDIPRFAGGGIGMVRSLQPGGIGGEMTADVYGAQVETLPFLKQIEPGGFLGATTPGRLDYEDRKRAEEEAAAEAARKSNGNFEAVIAPMIEEEKKKQRFETQGYAHGGISSLGSYSDGGRMLRGPGDGMSDDIPGVIAGKQPARLADGEFVVPADVVSHLGNGSTDAGAKKLYSMMDNVRKARTGSKKQGKQIKADKYMPGMKSGGIAYYDEGGDTSSEQVATKADVEAAINAARGTPAGMSTEFQASGYEPSAAQYSPYTMANRPSSSAPQYYQDIYQPSYPDYSTPGYTLAGNLGQWSNVMGEQQRAAQPASMNQQVTQSYLQNLGRAPDTEGFNYWMQSGLTAPQINRNIQEASPESIQRDPTNTANINALVEQMYRQNLGRPAEQAGLDYWTSQITSGQRNPYDIMQAIKTSPEAKMRLGNSLETIAPSTTFDADYYLAQNPDVAQNWRGSALEHYQQFGKKEGRAMNASQALAAKTAKKRAGGIASLV